MSDLSEFAERVRGCWSLATASTYSFGNPALGQCSVTALVAQDHLGGTIAKTDAGGAWHFYNLIDGQRLDFTSEQFDRPVYYQDVPSTREEAFTDTTRQQYEALSRAIRSAAEEGDRHER